MTKSSSFTKNQTIFAELFIGTLLYAVVMGFFNDYTDFLNISSFSTIFFAAIIMQILTYLTFALKKHVVNKVKTKNVSREKTAIGFSVWLIMFLSKFVFLWVIDVIFGNNVEISGFVGLVLIIASMTIVYRLAQISFQKLGSKTTAIQSM